ncbi:hypothetical protein HanRHA438_Chr03g0145711 [Helianthus annuus]|nr:hypothetical protein HanRHA438_Chr03g0145711 [Helianthus annuus]
MQLHLEKKNTRNHKNSVPENDFISHLHQRLQAIRRKLPRKHIRQSKTRPPKIKNQLRRQLRRIISMRVSINTIRPINPSQRIPSTSIRIHIRQKRRKIMLFRITRLRPQTRQPKLLPQPPFLNHHQPMPPRKRKKLRTHTKIFELYFRGHHIIPSSSIPIPQVNILINYFNKAFIFQTF